MAARRAISLTRGPGGVVHLAATDDADLYWRLGYCHAHDRALQLLLTRIVISGRACELLQDDDEMMAADRWMRRIGLARDLDTEVAKLSPADRTLADSYCAGINAALAERMPWELRALRYRPEPWTVADSIVLSRAMGYVQFSEHQAEMERLLVQMVQAGVPRESLEEIFCGRLEGLDVELVRQVRQTEGLIPDSIRWSVALPRAVATNNWVLAPSRTRSGRAILSSDVHLEVNRLPAFWYESVFELDDRFLITATIPGLPFPAIGRTDELAWAPGYGAMDTVDSWIEDCRDGRFRRRIDGADRWERFRKRTEVIKRKHRQAVTLTLFENDHGLLDGDPTAPGLYLSTGWTGHDTGAALLSAGFAMLHAADVTAGMQALGRIETSWHWVLADATGDIGYQQSGRMPLRRAGWSGLVPLPGWDPANDWAGFATPEELPRARNPKAGYLASANNDLNHLGVRHPVNLPMGQDRAARIGELLEGRSDWTVDTVLEMQLDVYSKQAERFMAILRPLLPASESARVLRDWDCRYDEASHGAVAFERFYHQLLSDVFGDACGPQVARYLLAETAVIPGMFCDFDRPLLDPDSGWFGPGGRDAAFLAAAARALAAPTRPWSGEQRFTFKHLMLGGRLPRWAGFDRGPYPLPGGRATIRQGQLFRQAGRETTWSPGARFITDFTEIAAHTALAGGPSDRRFSRWYGNEIDDWRAGRTKRLVTGLASATPANLRPHSH
ncbi:penicillin acylase family protein [Streptomyces sp. NPDC001260]|uniref:penicillin acylase family protein n=1 Tax=Streptomyces sp. NPDC001260 TaxID=3364551 RepID=UPI0036AD0375